MTKPNCSKCGDLKSGSYVNEGWCGKCTAERRKKLRIKKRQAADLPPYGSGRDPKCKDCRAIKEDPYKNGNYCRTCKCVREKARYDQKKKELGVLSKKPKKGRNPVCKCGNPKENVNESQCNKCTCTRKRLFRLKKRENPEWLAKNIAESEQILSQKAKLACRIETRKLIFKGILKYAPCEICGTTEDIQAHHDDYRDASNVRWLCRNHHSEYHMKQESKYNK